MRKQSGDPRGFSRQLDSEDESTKGAKDYSTKNRGTFDEKAKLGGQPITNGVDEKNDEHPTNIRDSLPKYTSQATMTTGRRELAQAMNNMT